MVKLNILIVNNNEKESLEWSSRLEKAGFCIVTVTQNLSGMVFSLSHEKVHIVLCASNLIKYDSCMVLGDTMKFFPRVKIVVVGNISLPELLPKLTNVVIQRNFTSQLQNIFEFPGNEKNYGNDDDVLRLLLGEHFLTQNESATMLNSISSYLAPDFVVISIKTDSNNNFIMHVLDELARKLSLRAALKFSTNEICVVLDQNPTVQRSLDVADTIRLHLLQRTDSSFSIGVSRSRRRADELFACRKESLRAAEATHLYGRDSVIHISYLDDNDIWYAYPYHKEKRLIEYTLDGDTGRAVKLLDELFLFLDEHQSLPQNYVNKIAMRIWTELKLAAASRMKALETAQMDSMSYGKLLASKSHEDVYKFLKGGIEGLADEICEIFNVRRDILFERISQLKSKDNQVTVSELTKEFHTTISFLNDAVIRNSDKNIFDFFNGG